MAKRQMTIAQIRNLPQYKGLSEEELEKKLNIILYGGMQEKINAIIKNFEDDYDLSEMTANDQLALLELARIFTTLESIEKQLQTMLNEENTDWFAFEKVNKIASVLRDDASRFQRDLNITRKARQDSGGQSVVDFIEDIKSRAKKFQDRTLSSIFCPKCKMLLAKIWLLYPEEASEFSIVCKRCKKPIVVKAVDIKNGKNVEVGPPR